jgi:hypothetical protein
VGPRTGGGLQQFAGTAARTPSFVSVIIEWVRSTGRPIECAAMRSQRRGLTAGVIERIGTAVYVVLMAAAQEELVLSLETLSQAVLAKLDGLGEYDLRRPLTPTGSNMLGIVKHLASVQAGYFGDIFARPWPEPMPWLAEDAAINDDMFATAAESIALGEAETIDRR